MVARTDNAIRIHAPFELIWDITNDVPAWPRLFSEYSSADVLDTGEDYVSFRLTLHPDEQGKVWSWVSERRLDRTNRRVSARRLETGPFEYMSINWTYQPESDGYTLLRWEQDFAMKPNAPLDDTAMADRINANSRTQLELIKDVVESAARTPSLRGYTLSGPAETPLPLADRVGRSLIVILGNRGTQSAGHALVDELRLDPGTSDLSILQVAHLKGVPRSLRKFAEAEIYAGHHKQVARAVQLRRKAGLSSDTENAAIGLGLDWNGVIGSDFAFGPRDTVLTTIVTDSYLCAIATIRGNHPLPDVIAALQASSTLHLRDVFG